MALFGPVGATGAKVILMVHEVPATSCPPAMVHESLPLSGNSCESVFAMLKVSVVAPPLVTVTV